MKERGLNPSPDLNKSEESVEYEQIVKLLDKEAQTLVGILCKRVEVLEQEKVLSPRLYKSLTKEIVYETFRNFKKLLKVYLQIGKVEFKSRD